MRGKPQRKGDNIMKKMKKIMAMLLAMVMVLGMTVSTMAAPNSATITVENLEEGTTIKSVQVIEPDTEAETGWKFSSEAMSEAFKSVYTNLDDQEIIWRLIAFADSESLPDDKKDVSPATPEEVKNAIHAIGVENYSNENVVGNAVTVFNAGVYAIYATPVEGSDTVYAPMAGYVSFTYSETGVPSGLNDTIVYAKKSSIPMEKTTTDDDHATEIGKIVTYTINTNVPYGLGLNEWKITDNINGASYVTDTDGNVEVTVTVGTTEAIVMKTPINEDGKSFTLDLTSLIREETNYGADVVLTYKAKVTDTEVSNTVSDGEHTSDEVKLYTGTITLTKWNEDQTKKLAGAKFEVRKGGAEGAFDANAEALKFKADTEGVAGRYTYDPNGTITEVETGADGTLEIKGLDVGKYYFKETEAPDGYHVKDDPKGYDAEGELKVTGEATSIFEGEASLTNSKLSSLPGTGGIGTTIFTIGGCAIMVAAAGLFFASRRKANK